jgi:hypothetical protein
MEQHINELQKMETKEMKQTEAKMALHIKIVSA